MSFFLVALPFNTPYDILLLDMCPLKIIVLAWLLEFFFLTFIFRYGSTMIWSSKIYPSPNDI